ncbi:hypothetical protein L2E82_28358 [Cichorium intybus]|uniref:Uncharacterized protein n=1 Tax=Cichorium intybus TaxID=13427 RepID=A0ACB9CVH6_CICIN|nr:hypothetical protein L2E82_28358 [Cichorium intybus]
MEIEELFWKVSEDGDGSCKRTCAFCSFGTCEMDWVFGLYLYRIGTKYTSIWGYICRGAMGFDWSTDGPGLASGLAIISEVCPGLYRAIPGSGFRMSWNY